MPGRYTLGRRMGSSLQLTFPPSAAVSWAEGPGRCTPQPGGTTRKTCHPAMRLGCLPHRSMPRYAPLSLRWKRTYVRTYIHTYSTHMIPIANMCIYVRTYVHTYVHLHRNSIREDIASIHRLPEASYTVHTVFSLNVCHSNIRLTNFNIHHMTLIVCQTGRNSNISSQQWRSLQHRLSSTR